MVKTFEGGGGGGGGGGVVGLNLIILDGSIGCTIITIVG